MRGAIIELGNRQIALPVSPVYISITCPHITIECILCLFLLRTISLRPWYYSMIILINMWIELSYLVTGSFICLIRILPGWRAQNDKWMSPTCHRFALRPLYCQFHTPHFLLNKFLAQLAGMCTNAFTIDVECICYFFIRNIKTKAIPDFVFKLEYHTTYISTQLLYLT